MKINFSGKTVWITGASSGIGESLAYDFSKVGAKVILSARRQEELERVQEACKQFGNETLIYTLDLSNPEEVSAVADKVLSEVGDIDVLVNNGGVSQRGLVKDTLFEVDRSIMEINYFSGVILTKKVLPGMIKNKFGYFIAISSMTGLFGFPLRSAYCASKHAMKGFYETLRAETKEYNIGATIAYAGRIKTNISFHAVEADGTAHGKLDKGQANGIPVEACTRKIFRAATRNKPEVFIARKEMILANMKRFIPALFFNVVSKVDPT